MTVLSSACPHSPQNLALPSVAPQFWQNVPAGAAASGLPQCWQNLPPPLSALHDGHIAVAWSR